MSVAPNARGSETNRSSMIKIMVNDDSDDSEKDADF